jgi:hypothetical protein
VTKLFDDAANAKKNALRVIERNPALRRAGSRSRSEEVEGLHLPARVPAPIERASAAGDLVRRGRQVVAAPDGGTATNRGQGVLQTVHQRLERLGEGQPDPPSLAEAQNELEQQVRESPAGDRDRELGGVGEVEREVRLTRGRLKPSARRPPTPRRGPRARRRRA